MNFVYRLAMILGCLGLYSCAASNGSSSSVPAASVATGRGPALVIAEQIPFAEDAMIREEIRNECGLPAKLSQFIRENVSGYSSRIYSDSAEAPSEAQKLNVEIYDVSGGGGGAWSGGKSVSIRGTLEQNGKVIGSFKGRRYSGGGMFAGFKGTCSIMGRCVKALGQDVAEWLRHPSQNAMLGDL